MIFQDQLCRVREYLIVRTLPYVAEEECFALKGGTAINLFIRDLPRLSVDIDLTFLPIADRDQSLAEIDDARTQLVDNIASNMSEDHKHFLVSFYRRKPEWSLLGLDSLAAHNSPALQAAIVP